jgi:hypothetical protein
VAAAIAPAAVPTNAPAASGCDLYASTNGSDSASGSESAPLRSVQKLIDKLSSGQTGCLQAGTYTDGGGTYVARFNKGGINLRSVPGARATVKGKIYFAPGNNKITVSNLTLDGRNSAGSLSISPEIMASDITLENNVITNEGTAICAMMGANGYGRAVRTVIRNNLFRNCGKDSHFEHAIYLQNTDDVQITDNVFKNSSAWAVHFYPDSQGTVVKRNVIDNNGSGVIFAGEGSQASSNNVVEQNVITNSKMNAGVLASWGSTVGRGNVVRNNCMRNSMGNIGGGGGFSVSGTVDAEPKYVNASAGDYRLTADSPCRSLLGGDAFNPGPSGSGSGSGSGGGSGTPAPAPTPSPTPTPTPAPTTKPGKAKGHKKPKKQAKKKARIARTKSVRKARAACKVAAKKAGIRKRNRKAAVKNCVAHATRSKKATKKQAAKKRIAKKQAAKKVAKKKRAKA